MVGPDAWGQLDSRRAAFSLTVWYDGGSFAAIGVEDHVAEFRYAIYIRAEPAQIWRGLTEPDVTERYWRHETAGPKTFRSEWTEGSTWDLEHRKVGLVVSDPEQMIIESDPYRRLVYTWHSFTPEWVAEVGMDEQTAEAWRAEERSTVAYNIEDVGNGVTKLMVVHYGFSDGSHVLRAISEGWPSVLSSLKSLLETGEALP